MTDLLISLGAALLWASVAVLATLFLSVVW